jgi:putative membrane protein
MAGQEQTAIKDQVKLASAWRQTIRVSLPSPDTRRIPATLLIAINGFLLIVSLVALVRMWLP